MVAHREALLDAIRDHQVVVVAGETGSGQEHPAPQAVPRARPRACAGSSGTPSPAGWPPGRCPSGSPRSSARTIGDAVGFTVRFNDRVGEDTFIKVMTDGILLAEIQRDRHLRAYEVLIIDEAHERSLNIDFLLGYLRQLLPERPDLKVIVTSATIDTARFAAHFGGAPVVEVSGRSYPVEVRYRPFGEDEGDDRDQTQAIVDAVQELMREGPGDLLVFLSGERDIRDTADALARLDLARRRAPPAVRPPVGRRAAPRVRPAPGPPRSCSPPTSPRRRSRCPGIVGVIDPGTARISRYNRRTKVQRLPIEAISQASAAQRAGRCGRVAPGTCIRLYSEEDFDARPEFTEPEILRTNLASVILQMAALGLGDIAAFPFVEPPDARSIKDGILLLEELGALDRGRAARPRPAHPARPAAGPHPRRPAAGPHGPRGRPPRRGGRGARARGRAVDPGPARATDRRGGGGRRPPPPLRRPRLRLRRLPQPLALPPRAAEGARLERVPAACARASTSTTSASASGRTSTASSARWRSASGSKVTPARRRSPTVAGIHRALLAGLLSHVGMLDPDGNEYRGAREARFVLAPGTGARQAAVPKWVMAAELVETNRLRARTVAQIEPGDIEQVAGHLVTRSYEDPWWDEARGEAMTTERVSLYGLPVVTGRRKPVDQVDPRPGPSDVPPPRPRRRRLGRRAHAFVRAEPGAGGRRRRARSSGCGATCSWATTTLVAFFDARVPDDVTSARRFGTLVGEGAARRARPAHLPTAPTSSSPPPASPTWPTSPRRGRSARPGCRSPTCSTPPRTSTASWSTCRCRCSTPSGDAGLDWQVPGPPARPGRPRCIRTLPKDLRRRHTPAGEAAADVLGAPSAPTTGRCWTCWRAALTERGGPPWRPHHLDLASVPDHLRVTYRAVDDAGRPLAWSKDLAALRRRLAERVREALATASPVAEVHGATVWAFGTIPDTVTVTHAGHAITGLPRARRRGRRRRPAGAARPSPRRAPRCGAAPGGCSSCSSAHRCARSTGPCRTR